MNASALLVDVAAEHPQQKGKRGTAIRTSIKRLEWCLLRPPIVADLTFETWHRFADWLTGQGYSQPHRCNMQTALRDLWRFAYKSKITAVDPDESSGYRNFESAKRRRARTVFDRRSERTWSDDEVERLLEAASTRKFLFPHLKNGVQQAGFWRCFVLLTQETRLLKPFIFRIRFDHIDAERKVCDMRGVPWIDREFPISSRTIKEINSIAFPKRELVLDYSSNNHTHNCAFQSLLDRAKVQYRPHGQTVRNRRATV